MKKITMIIKNFYNSTLDWIILILLGIITGSSLYEIIYNNNNNKDYYIFILLYAILIVYTVPFLNYKKEILKYINDLYKKMPWYVLPEYKLKSDELLITLYIPESILDELTNENKDKFLKKALELKNNYKGLSKIENFKIEFDKFKNLKKKINK